LTGSDPTIFGGAKDDDSDSMTGVVALRVGAGRTFELCSGALLAPNVVLTARHCVTRNLTTSVSCDENGKSANGRHVAGDEEPTNIGVYTGASPMFAQEPAAFAKAVISPRGSYLCDSDIALVVLERPLSGVQPLKVRLATGALPGETIRSVGYGQTDNRQAIGTRYRKERVEVLAMGKAVSRSKTPLGLHEFEVGKSICQGDSGGPAISEDTGAVIGVVSRGGGCDEDFGHVYTTTAGFQGMFDEAFALAETSPQLEEGTAATQRAHEPAASEPAENGGCSVTRTGSSGGPSGSAFAGAGLALVAVALVMARRARRNT